MKKPAVVILASLFMFINFFVYLGVSFLAFSFSNMASALGAAAFNPLSLMALLGLISCILYFIVSVAILKRKGWARLVALILSFAWTIFWVIGFENSRESSDLLFLIPNLLMLVIIVFTFKQEKVKAFFNQSNSVPVI